MKLSTLFLIMLAIEFSIIIFSEGTYVDNTPLIGAALNPHVWSDTIMFATVGLIIAGAIISGSWVGSVFYGKADIMIYATLVGVMILWLVPIVSLFDLIYNNISATLGTSEIGMAGISIGGARLIAGLICAPLIVLAFTTTLNWWRTAFAEV
jgi:hypothetical protein